MNSSNVTVTEGRLKKALKDNIEPIMLPKVERTITKEVNNSKIRTGVITKFYPYLDKAEVKFCIKLFYGHYLILLQLYRGRGRI